MLPRTRISLLVAAGILLLGAGSAIAYDAVTTTEDTSVEQDVGYCKSGTPQTNCLAFGCRGEIGRPASCGYYVCRVWTGFSCLV